MNKDNVNQILDALAARLGTPAAHLWAVLVRQAAIEFWTQAGLTLFAWALVLVGLRYTRSRWEDWDDFQPIVLVIGGAAVAATIIATIVTIQYVGYLLNPEYYALREVLGALK